MEGRSRSSGTRARAESRTQRRAERTRPDQARSRNPAGAVRHFIHAAQSAPRESTYGQNVYVAIQRAVAPTIYIASMGSFMLLYMTMFVHMPRVTIVAGLGTFAALAAGFGAVQLWRMPPEARPLFRTRGCHLPGSWDQGVATT
jgi:hypothetical protein